MANQPKLLRYTLRIVLALLGLACIAYLSDFLLLRWKFSHKGKAFDRVIVRRYFAVPHKGGKEEYLEDDPHAESCVNSLFPHSAVPPCWYLNRHREQRVDM